MKSYLCVELGIVCDIRTIENNFYKYVLNGLLQTDIIEAILPALPFLSHTSNARRHTVMLMCDIALLLQLFADCKPCSHICHGSRSVICHPASPQGIFHMAAAEH